MKTHPGFASALFLLSALAVTIAAFAVLGTIGWGITGLIP